METYSYLPPAKKLVAFCLEKYTTSTGTLNNLATSTSIVVKVSRTGNTNTVQETEGFIQKI